MKTIRGALALAALFSCCQPSHARDLGTGPLPIKIDAVVPIDLAADEELQIEGVVEAAATVIVVLRIDDMTSWSFASRFNGERALPPGRFRWTIAAKALRTADGRTLDHRQLRRVIFFVGRGEGKVRLTKFDAASAARLPGDAKGYSLGAQTAEVPAGFERLSAGDPRVEGAHLIAIHRPAPDPLLMSGLRGVERVRLPWTGGPARVTIWTEDPGEWELLPHPTERRIRINGHDALVERLTPDEWIERRYLRGLDIEHGPADDAWTAYGRLRGDSLSVDVEPSANGIVIELAGSDLNALYLAAVLIEPVGSVAARDQVEAMRAEWYRSNWPVITKPAMGLPAPLFSVTGVGVTRSTQPLRASAARGTGARLTLRVVSDVTIEKPKVALDVPGVSGLVWAAQSRLERRFAGDTVLVLADDMLTGVTERLALKPGQPRTYEAWIDVPADATPGIRMGAITIGSDDRTLTIPVSIEVLAIALPAVAKPAGFYADEAPHLTWFSSTAADRHRQANCDLRFLAHMGLTGSAPPLATPTAKVGVFEDDMERAAHAGLASPWFAYAPAKRLLEREGIEGSADTIARIQSGGSRSTTPAPIWSLADEPSNPGQPAQRLKDWIAAIRSRVPGAKIAAQLNSPHDRALVASFDVVLLNEGYGIDLPDLQSAKSAVNEVWLYNTERPRVTAGFWLWRSAANRYLQWHARMPTADPFDPIDGREGDVQALLPDRTICPATPTIDRSVLDMADGLVDQRWLTWLSRAPGASAEALRRTLNARMPSQWEKAAALSPTDLQAMRESIMEVARQTN